MKKYRYALFLLSFVALILGSNPSYAATYTYLRCFYQENLSNLTPATSYVWGLDSSNNYYHINGYWKRATSMENMFYSDTTQDEMLSVCKSTLLKNEIKSPVAMHAAADSASSINYAVWTLDSKEQNGKINKIVAFGDSLSDTQNLFNASYWNMLKNASYFAGRFSNGKNWLDFVSEDLHLPAYNWAVGGAGADDHYLPLSIRIPGLDSQVSSWIDYMNSATNYKPANTLFTVLIGENDLANYGLKPDDVINSELNSLLNLIAAGAKNILLINLPDVSRAPIFALRSKQETALAHEKVLRFNYRLSQIANELKEVNGSGLNIQVFDAFSLVEFLMENPAAFGFTNTEKSCLDINSDTMTNYLYTWYPRKNDAMNPVNNCTDADTFVFWDLLHPTTHAHKQMAEIMTEFIQSKYNL